MNHDRIVQQIYRAAAGLEPCVNPLESIAREFDAWVVHFHGTDKRGGQVETSPRLVGAPSRTRPSFG